jgi:hypothetical protein
MSLMERANKSIDGIVHIGCTAQFNKINHTLGTWCVLLDDCDAEFQALLQQGGRSDTKLEAE